MQDLGKRVYGLAAIFLGLVGLRWGDFAAVWQPVPADTPGRTALAYAAAAVLLACGMAMQWRRTAKGAALVLAAVYAVFALLWVRRILAYPQVFGTWSGTAEELAIAVGGLVAYASLVGPDDVRAIQIARIGRLAFGVCLVAFGFAHFLYVPDTAALVPKWLPPSQSAWAIVTGVAHVAAGLALLSGVLALIAARLLTAMFVVFGALVWAPQIFAHPDSHMVWSGNGVNLALIGAAWVVADSIGRFADRLAAVSADLPS